MIKQFDKIRPNSIVLLEQIRVIDKSRLKGFVTTLNEEQIVEVNTALIHTLDIKFKK